MSKLTNIVDKKELSLHFDGNKIGVVTALQSELDALIRLAKNDHEIVTPSRVYHKLTFQENGTEFTVIGHSLNKMGMTSMTITLMEMLSDFSLEYLALIGIAAGSDSENQDFGDLLIPTKIFNYESGKYTQDKEEKIIFTSDKDSHDVDTDIIQQLSVIANNQNILDSIQNAWHEKKGYKLKAHVDNFACGSSVVASKCRVAEIEKDIARKYIGIDMETYAIVAVNQLKAKVEPKMFAIKAITDFADSDKDNTAHSYASFTASKFFLEFCSRILVDRIKEKRVRHAI
ncbi:MAG: hypothetical protein WCP69_12405 [Bacteroidota bacterium]